MPSNAELAEEIRKIDPGFNVEGLTNAQRVDALKAMRATLQQTSETPEATEELETEETPAAPEELETEETPAAPEELETEETPAAPEEPETEETPAAPEEPVVAGFQVAEGKAITSKKGVLVAGDPVKPKFFAGGETCFKNLFEKGFIEVVAEK